MDNEKIDEIGEKLKVNSSVIKQKKSHLFLKVKGLRELLPSNDLFIKPENCPEKVKRIMKILGLKKKFRKLLSGEKDIDHLPDRFIALFEKRNNQSISSSNPSTVRKAWYPRSTCTYTREYEHMPMTRVSTRPCCNYCQVQ